MVGFCANVPDAVNRNARKMEINGFIVVMICAERYITLNQTSDIYPHEKTTFHLQCDYCSLLVRVPLFQ